MKKCVYCGKEITHGYVCDECQKKKHKENALKTYYRRKYNASDLAARLKARAANIEKMKKLLEKNHE